jgi:hypothetical protein
MKNTTDNKHPFVGKLLEDYMQQHRKSAVELSKALGLHPNTAIKMKYRPSMQISLLWQLSHIYQHNFIGDIAVKLPSNYTGGLSDALAEKDREIAAVRDELAAITKERDLYRDLLKK